MRFTPFINAFSVALLFLISTSYVQASPIKTTSTPARTTSTPVKTASTPAKTTSTPAKTTSTPAKTTSTPSAPTPTDDLQCPKGYSPSFLHNTYTYDAPLNKFTDITKSFFHIQWYGGATVTKTAGTDNVPGATRAGVFGGAKYNETLTAYSARADAMSYTIHGNLPLTLAQGNQPPLHVASYAETKRFESICGGKATYIDLITYMCTDNQITGYNAFYNTHMTTLENLASTIGSPVLAGDCEAADVSVAHSLTDSGNEMGAVHRLLAVVEGGWTFLSYTVNLLS
ncbi:hypothetical protein DFH09DRAFT_1278540 [Mycena vulgaris]|nr:hypothetical protein DFH09DRAFT_1278540 [Mycena vulgaris]